MGDFTGELTKRGRLFKTWTRRVFTLNLASAELAYSKQQSGKKKGGGRIIAVCASPTTGKHPYCLDFELAGRTVE